MQVFHHDMHPAIADIGSAASVSFCLTVLLVLTTVDAIDGVSQDACETSKSSTAQAHAPEVTWRVGDWSKCRQDRQYSAENKCALTLSTRTRSVRCIQLPQRATGRPRVVSDSTCRNSNLTVRPANWSLCNGPCYRPEGDDYLWLTSEWTACNYLCYNNASQQPHTQSRTVSCQHRPSGAFVADAFCHALVPKGKPRWQRDCRFQDADCVDGKPPQCAYEQWSKWSSCRMTCGMARCRTRARIPVTFPLNSQRQCVDTTQISKCVKSSDRSYILKSGPWEACTGGEHLTLTTHRRITYQPNATVYQAPRIGQQRRKMYCVRTPDAVVMDSFSCLQHNIPADGYVRRLCVIPQDCEVTQWGDWRPTRHQHKLCILKHNNLRLVWPTNATAARTRKVKIQPFGEGKPCPSLRETRPVSVSLAVQLGVSPCRKLYEWFAGEWLDCIVLQDVHSRHVHCGPGSQQRSVFCRLYNDTSNTPVSDDLCVSARSVHAEKPAMTQACHKTCVANCRLSEWSNWSGCEQLDCKNSNRTAAGGRQTRYRTVLTEPDDRGEPCDHLAESRECGYKNCLHYVIDEAVGPCGKKSGDNPGGRWGCVYRARWGERRKKCRCAKRCPSWQQVREENYWRNFADCEPINERNATEFHQMKYRAHQSLDDDKVKYCPTEFATRPCVPTKKKTSSYAWHAERFPLLCEKPYRRQQLRSLEKIREGPLPKCKPCDKGLKYRVVYCVRVDPVTGQKRIDKSRNDLRYLRADPRKCPPRKLYRPHTIETCHICCPGTCKFSSWGAWGACQADVCISARPYPRIAECSGSVTCAASAAGHRSRQRYQLETKNDDKACTNPVSEQACTLQKKLCYSWQTGNWSHCSYMSKLPCLGGFRTRFVFCRQSDGRPVTADNCAHLKRPVAAELCRKQCDEICLFTQWSDWSLCSETVCGAGHRTRTRQLLVNTDIGDALAVLAKSCGSLKQTELCSQRPCRQYKVDYSPWGAWSPITGEDGRCRIMKKTRISKCFEIKGQEKKSWRRVPFDFCRPTRLESTNEHQHCQYGCEFTQWQSWTGCDQPCGHGWQHRTRKRLRDQTSDGRACPDDTIQQKPCFRKVCTASVYIWHEDPWSPCRSASQAEIVDNEVQEPVCGGQKSKQYRKVMCLEIKPGNEKFVVDDQKCRDLRRPKSSQKCTVVCPQDCQWSQWGVWSSCEGGRKIRQRDIARESERDGFTCVFADAVETKRCSQRVSRTYSISVGNWTPCQRLRGDSCALAEQRRLAVCKDNRGGLATNASRCPEMAKIKTVRPCCLPCHRDCQLSPWTDWTVCDSKCGIAKDQTRERKIIRTERGSGANCSSFGPLNETRPCSNRPCYKSKIYPWGQCISPGADCGIGTRIRQITCRRSDNELVSPLKCFDDELGPNQHLDTVLKVITETEPCHKACPGECQYTLWSDWSPSCIANCNSRINNTDQYKGRKIAVRSLLSAPNATIGVCRGALWRSKKCKISFCMTFEWRAGEWNDTWREVWCERSDGKRVTDEACQSRQRPQRQRCLPPCTSEEVCVDATCHLLVDQGMLCVGANCRQTNTNRIRRDADENQQTQESCSHSEYAYITAEPEISLGCHFCQFFKTFYRK